MWMGIALDAFPLLSHRNPHVSAYAAGNTFPFYGPWSSLQTHQPSPKVDPSVVGAIKTRRAELSSRTNHLIGGEMPLHEIMPTQQCRAQKDGLST